jgi:Tfp pilus assembly protein FimT
MQSLRRTSPRRRRRAFHCRSQAQASRAFSVIELTIVILIMSIFAAASAPAFMDSLLFHRVEAASRRVKADIEYCRQLARLKSTTQTITFTAAGTYTVSGAKSMGKSTGTYAVNLKQSPYSLDSAVANFSNTLVLSFNGYGSPSSGGTVVLTAKTHQCTVTVDSVTGAATITTAHANGGMAQVDSL